MQIKVFLKQGERDEADHRSDRPICLLPVIGKIFERLFLQLLVPTLERYASEHQHDFKSGRSTEDAATAIFDTIQSLEEHLAIASVYSSTFRQQSISFGMAQYTGSITQERMYEEYIYTHTYIYIYIYTYMRERER